MPVLRLWTGPPSHEPRVAGRDLPADEPFADGAPLGQNLPERLAVAAGQVVRVDQSAEADQHIQAGVLGALRPGSTNGTHNRAVPTTSQMRRPGAAKSQSSRAAALPSRHTMFSGQTSP